MTAQSPILAARHTPLDVAPRARPQLGARWLAIAVAVALVLLGTQASAPVALALDLAALAVVALAGWHAPIRAPIWTAARGSDEEHHYQTVFNTVAIAIWEYDFSQVAAALQDLRASGVTDLRQHLHQHPCFIPAMRQLVRITDVNVAALAMMGLTEAQRPRALCENFLHDADASFAECLIAIDERHPLFQTEAIVRSLDGEPHQVIIALCLGQDIALRRVPASVLDVSHRRALEIQLQKTREQLARVQRTGALAAMSASIAHELNQPMAAIHSFADAARRWLSLSPPNVGETASALEGLSESVTHAQAVMARIRSLVGNAQIDFAEVELDGLLLTTVALMRREAAESGTRLQVIAEEDKALSVAGDRILLKQVFVNLVSNAIQAMQATPAADRVVTIALERRRDSAVVIVSDRGRGWDELDNDRAFDSFFTTRKDGMGLGLSISRTVVERHGGMILRYNRQGGGAVVEVQLPLVSGLLGGGAGARCAAGAEGGLAVA